MFEKKSLRDKYEFLFERGYRGVNMSLFEGFDYEILKGIIYEKRHIKIGDL